jgi:hypothetical protein
MGLSNENTYRYRLYLDGKPTKQTRLLTIDAAAYLNKTLEGTSAKWLIDE